MTELKSMESEDFSNYVSVVFPAAFPSRNVQPDVKNLHCTVFSLGDLDSDLNGVPAQTLLDALHDIPTNVIQYVNTDGWDLFGPENDIPVVKLMPAPLLLEIHHHIKYNLEDIGIHSNSEFDYSPHVTVDPGTYHNNNMPPWVLLDRAQLWYAGEKILVGNSRKSFIVGRPSDNYV